MGSEDNLDARAQDHINDLRRAATNLCGRTMPFGHIVGDHDDPWPVQWAKTGCLICGFNPGYDRGEGKSPRYEMAMIVSAKERSKVMEALSTKRVKLAKKLQDHPELEPYINLG